MCNISHKVLPENERASTVLSAKIPKIFASQQCLKKAKKRHSGYDVWKASQVLTLQLAGNLLATVVHKYRNLF